MRVVRVSVAAIVAAQASLCGAATVTFGNGASRFQMEFVTIANPGNSPDAADHTGLAMGAVDYVYQIGKFEVACEALSAFQSGSTSGQCSGGRRLLPAANGWDAMARFVNWLNTSSGYPPAYRFEGREHLSWDPTDPGYNPANPSRSSLAIYVIPTADEWHKAAYYDPSTSEYYDYATGSDALPLSSQTPVTSPGTAVYFVPGGPRIGQGVDVTQAGGLSPYGTMGQTGNIAEWEEGFFFGNAHTIRTGGESGIDLLKAENSRQLEFAAHGLRVVRLVPESATASRHHLAMLAVLVLCRISTRRGTRCV